jgi:hypothetical protein
MVLRVYQRPNFQIYVTVLNYRMLVPDLIIHMSNSEFNMSAIVQLDLLENVKEWIEALFALFFIL